MTVFLNAAETGRYISRVCRIRRPLSDVFINDSEASFHDYIKHLMKQLLCKSSVSLSEGGILSRKGQSTCDLIGA